MCILIIKRFVPNASEILWAARRVVSFFGVGSGVGGLGGIMGLTVADFGDMSKPDAGGSGSCFGEGTINCTFSTFLVY